MNRFTRQSLLWSAVALAGLAGAAVSHADEHGRGDHEDYRRDGRGQILDDRYHHGHYYPAPGAVVRTLPDGYRAYTWQDGRHYYFGGGAWYAPGPLGFVVTHPPVGLFLSVLPPFATTVWFGGVPYYYADGVYYAWHSDQNGYVVVDPPASTSQPESPAAPPADDFYVYPRNGQSAEQQAADRYECHSWSQSQTGYDPTAPNGGVDPADNAPRRDQYRRAITACLEARGYSVK